MAFAHGRISGCGGIGEGTTCCSGSTKWVCESLVMTQPGSTVSNIIFAARDRGTEWVELLAIGTNNPRLATSTRVMAEQFSSVSDTPSAALTAVSMPLSSAYTASSTTLPSDLIRMDAPEAATSANNNVPVGAIVGGVFGGVAGVSLIALVWYLRKRMQYRAEASSDGIPAQGTNMSTLISPAFLPPQSLPELSSYKKTAPPPAGPAALPMRYYYGGVPKGLEDPSPSAHGSSSEAAKPLTGRGVP